MPEICDFIKMSDGAMIYYEDTKIGQPLILVPGYMATTKFFRKNVQELSKEYRVIVIDPRGQGLSSKHPEGHTLKRVATDIKEIIDYLDLKDVILMGWSMSGSVVTMYSDLFKDYRLKAIGFIDTPLFPFSSEDWNKNGCKGFNTSAYMESYGLLYYDREKSDENFANKLFLTPATDEDKHWIKEEIRKTFPFEILPYHYEYMMTDCLSMVKNISVPVIIYAADSKIYGLEMSKEIKKRVTSYCEYHEFYEGGHIFFYVEDKKFNEITLRFLENLKKL